jgi:hypothetical protein
MGAMSDDDLVYMHLGEYDASNRHKQVYGPLEAT